MPDGIYTPTRVLHGTTNAVMYLQLTMAAHLPDDLRHNILWWLDDIFIHYETLDDHLLDIRRFFEFCVTRNFKLHPENSLYFLPLSVGMVDLFPRMESVSAQDSLKEFAT